MILDSHLTMRGVTPELAEALVVRFTRFPNPEFEASRRYSPFGRPARGIPEFIELHDYDAKTGTLKLPRGLTPAIRGMFGYDRIADDRAFPNTFNDQVCKYRPTYEPRDYQADAVNAARTHEGGVVVAGTGTGKTVIGLELSRQLATPTLFLVHTQSLLMQTVDAVRRMLGVEPGVIGGGKWAPGWFTVATLQTLASRGAGDLADKFGLVILDEAHHCPARTFSAVVQQFTARYRVALTATPKRADGLTPILHAVMGPTVYTLDNALLPLRYQRIDTGWCPDKVPERKKRSTKKGLTFTLDGNDEKSDVDFTALMGALCEDRERLDCVCGHIASLHRGLSLVITERIQHAETLTAELRSRGLDAVMLAGPGANPAVRRDVSEGIAECRYSILVSTSGMVGEGFDLPRLDTLFLAAPHGQANKTQQLAGRVLRPYATKTYGQVYDFVDSLVKPLEIQWFRRQRVYRRLAGGGK